MASHAAEPPRPQRVVIVCSLLPIKLERLPDGSWRASWDEEISRPEISISRYLSVGVRCLPVRPFFIGSPQARSRTG